MKEKALPIWFATGFASVPVAILLHELGHYTTGRLLGWRDLAFHYARVNLASGGPIVAGATHAPWMVALGYVAGPAVSLALIFVAALLVGGSGRHPMPAGLGLSSTVRFLWPLATGIVVVLRWIVSNHAPFHPDLDEFNFAANSGMPPWLCLFSSFFAAAIALFWMTRRLWHRELASPLVSLALGVAVGFAFYLGLLGPRVLP